MSTIQDDSFWTSSQKLPISQKSVAIPSSNGLEYSGGQRVVIEIPSTIEFIQPKESYLQFEVQLQLPAGATYPTYLQLDDRIGAQNLLREVRIYSGGASKILLEEYVDYDVLTNLKYSYETNDVLKAKRAISEASSFHSVATRGTCGTTETDSNNVIDNPYFRNVSSDGAGQDLSNGDFNKVKVNLNLNTGLFSSQKVLPTLLTDGLVIDIILQDGNKVYRRLDTARRLSKYMNKPIFHSIDGDVAAPSPIAENTAVTEIYVTNDNNLIDADHLPFAIGERVSFSAIDSAGTADLDDLVVDETDPFIIDNIELDGANSLIKITFKGAGGKTAVGAGNVTGGDFILFSSSVGVDYVNMDYTISNVNMMVQQLEMPAGYKSKMMSMMKEGGSMNYDFGSFTNYKYSQLASDVVANIRLPLNMSRAKSILCIPTDATNYTPQERLDGGTTGGSRTYITFEEAAADSTLDKINTSDKSSLDGCVDFLSNYQFFYAGKLNPSRRVDCSKTSSQVSVSQIHLIELEKALSMANITPLSFRPFNTNFVIGKCLSLHNGFYDTRNKDFNLQVEYSESTAPTKNKLWMNFVYHIRRIEFRGDGISLQV